MLTEFAGKMQKRKKILVKVFGYDNDMSVPLIAVLVVWNILFSEVSQ